MPLNLYWGDLHSHCSISYGHGTVKQALARARQQLDFCSVTGHAFWPDMPTDRRQYGEIIDYHEQGFARLARNWNSLIEEQEQACQQDEFIAFPSYEWHSLEHGDHNVYSESSELPLLDAPNVSALRRLLAEQRRIAIPHHIGYRKGFRGINWDTYAEDKSPFVEIYSLHGCSLSDEAPYPMLHDMGPRDFGSTAEAGWERGFRFGIVGGTDHHAAYPGSHGDGRMGVLATQLTREALWDAFMARRVFAATGDKIDAQLEINEAPIGSCLQIDGSRNVRIKVRGIDALHTIELKKNGRPYQTWAAPFNPPSDNEVHRLRITWGWGRKTETTPWNLSLTLSEGIIQEVDTLFSGQAIVAPQQSEQDLGEDAPALPHELLETSDRSLTLRSVTQGNLSMRHERTQGLSLQIAAPLETRVEVIVNGHTISYPLGALLGRSQSHFMRGWLSEAVRIGPLVPQSDCQFDCTLQDAPDQPVDRYQLNVGQRNGQWAWLTPIWVQQ